MNRIVKIHSASGEGLLFKRMQGTEELSSLFDFELSLMSPNPNLDIKRPIGSSISVEILTSGNTPRFLNGMVTEFGLIGEDEDEDGHYLYRATLRPQLWYLTQNRNSRVFVNQSILDITRTILADYPFTYKIQCNGNYRQWGCCTQYQESDFDFLSRLFEQEGVYYFFEHDQDRHTLVLTDDPGSHRKVPGHDYIRYHAPAATSGTPHTAHIDSWHESAYLTGAQYTVGEYNYRKAKTALTAGAEVHAFSSASTEYYEFYAGFTHPDEAAHYGKIRSEEKHAQTHRINATGTALNIAPGYVFTLQAHPHLHSNTEYLIVSASYHLAEAGYTSGDLLGHYRIEFTCLPITVQYRAPRRTAKPHVVGVQAATVTGPAGEEVYTNKYGDIKIQFHWDRYGKRDESSSAWVRVIQGSAGGGFGSINTPRIGEEVLVDFVGGDTDRPVVVGRLYNSAITPPWGFPQAAKQSGIRSKSFNSPQENFNELMFNDTAGQELVNFQAQKDLTSLVKNDEARTVNHDRVTTVKNDETVTVEGYRTETVHKDETISIKQNRTETVDLDERISILKNRTRAVTLDERIGIGKNQAISVGLDQSTSVGINQSLTVGANRNKTIGENEVVSIGANRQQTITIASLNNVGAGQMTNIGLSYMLNVGAGWMTNVGAVEQHNVGLVFDINAGRNVSMDAGKNTTISAGEKLTLQCGETMIVMEKNGKITLSGKEIKIIGSKKVDIDGKKVDIN